MPSPFRVAAIIARLAAREFSGRAPFFADFDLSGALGLDEEEPGRDAFGRELDHAPPEFSSEAIEAARVEAFAQTIEESRAEDELLTAAQRREKDLRGLTAVETPGETQFEELQRLNREAQADPDLDPFGARQAGREFIEEMQQIGRKGIRKRGKIVTDAVGSRR